MVKCSECGKNVEEKEAVQLTIDGKIQHFHLPHVKKLTHRVLSKVVLTKTSAEIIAIGTGISGIAFTLQDLAERALVMDTLSAIAAIAAMFVGIEHL